MNHFLLRLCLLFLLSTSPLCSAVVTPALSPRVQEPPVRTQAIRSDWQVLARGKDETVWGTVTTRTNSRGVTKSVTNSYIEMASGLNVQSPQGQWIPSDPSFIVTTNGAETPGTSHRIILAPNINADNAVQIKRGALWLRNRPSGITYFDPETGESVILASLKDAGAWQTATNEIVYSNCF